MSDPSKFIPKKYQKKVDEDKMIKPIASLNVSNPAINPSLPTTNGQLNQSNTDSNISVPKLPNQAEAPSTNFPSNPTTTNSQANNNSNPPKNSGIQEKSSKQNKVKGSSKKKKTVLLLLLLLFFLVAGGAGLLLMRQRQDTRQEAYGESFCGPGYYGQYCINDPNRTWNGRCVLIYCPLGNEIGPGCSENDREARWEFGPCPELLAKARSNEHIAPGCWQVDAVSDNNVYCNVAGCKSYELDTSNCGNLVPTNTPTPTVPPTTIPPTAVPPTGVPPTTVPPTDTPIPTDTPTPTNTPTPTPTNTPTPTEYPRISCSATGCMNDEQCQEGLVCADIGNTGICSLPELIDLCIENQNFEACCTGYTPVPTATITSNPTSTPTTDPTSPPATPTPVITTVITTVGCNESCNENADCTNISHICYEGMCRLDVNPTDVNCRLADGGNVIQRAVEVPTESGFADWFNFIKVGFGILGLGALLLLLL